MKKKSAFRYLIPLTIFIIGSWLLFHSSSLTPENANRNQAVQSAFGPGGVRGGTGSDGSKPDQSLLVHGAAVSPSIVDISKIPSRSALNDPFQEAYASGQIDIEINDGPVSDALYQAMLNESLQQKVDENVQNYQANGKDAVTALSIGASFKSIDYTQSYQGVPPDPDIMVGKDHIVVGVNSSFQVFDKQGNSLLGPILYKDLWGDSCGTGSGMVMFDPYSGYDEENGRYVLGITAYDPQLNNGDNGYACIAVSQSDSATAQWWLYSFNGNPGSGSDYFFDYPHLGIGQDALYLAANMFGLSFVRNHVFALDKDAMYAGESADYLKYNVSNSSFTLQPAKLKGYISGGWPDNINEPHYFVSSTYGNNQDILKVWQFSDPWGSPSFSQIGTLTVNSYSLPVNQPQLDGSAIQGNDNRLLDVEYWGGKLWATHTIGCNPGSGTVNCVRWYEIDVTSSSPSLVQQGTFATDGEYNSFPDLGVNSCGDVVVGYTKTSPNMYPSIYVAGRQAAHGSGLLKEETLVQAGETFYTAFDSVPRRWGDYTGMALDPDGKTLWYVGEYVRDQSSARWSTWVAALTWPDCQIGPTPTFTPTPAPLFCSTYSSDDTPIALPDSISSINSTITIDSGVSISDLNVNIDMAHTWVGDLIITLSKNSSSTTLIDRPGYPATTYGCNNDDIFAILDDEASIFVENQCSSSPPTISGTLLPDSPLSVFDGLNSDGIWTLNVTDSVNGDSGILNSWGIEVCSEDPPPTATATSTPVTPTATPTNTPQPLTIQDIQLLSGWNKVSSYVQASEPNMAAVMADNEDKLVIVKNGNGQVYWPSQGINYIGDWDVRAGYQIYMTEAALLSIEGNQVNPGDTPINLEAGWNFISYLPDQSINIVDALNSISAELYLVKDRFGKIYWPEWGLDQIGSMNPGEGYQIYMTVQATLVYPDNE